VRILITGASGFIGRHVVRHFLDRGYQVRAHSRGGSVNPGLRETLVGNLDSVDEIEKALRDVDTIVHLGGLAHSRNVSDDEVNRVNVEWTRRIANQADSRLFVYVSSSKVYGEF